MQVDAIGNDDIETGKAMKRAMGLLAAFAVAAAAGLVAVDVPEADLSPRVLRTDAGSPAASPAARSTTAPATVPARGELDPTLRRTDQGNDHHG